MVPELVAAVTALAVSVILPIKVDSVTATSTHGAGIGSAGGTCSNIGISGGSVKAYSDRMPGINCTPHNGNSTKCLLLYY